MNVFYLIDKPIGISSFDIIRELRKKLDTRKMGHTGTLDPLASGLVLIAVGNYTKLIPYLEKDSKKYEFKIGLDGISESFDLGTDVQYISEEKKNKFRESIKLEDIKNILEEKFSGEISQIPPKYSALKIGGKRAYDLVRTGEDFNLKKRKVCIYDIEVLNFSYPDLTIKAKVSAGTYIRSIAYDLGEILGCGGYIKELRRTKIGNLDLKFSQTIEEFDGKNILEEKEIFDKNRFISLEEEYLKELNDGLSINKNFPFEVGASMFVYDGKSITNIVKFDGEKLSPVRRVVVDK